MLHSHNRKTAELHNLAILGWLLEVLIPTMQSGMRRISAEYIGAALAPTLLLCLQLHLWHY
jgi:hypothetical protein